MEGVAVTVKGLRCSAGVMLAKSGDCPFPNGTFVATLPHTTEQFAYDTTSELATDGMDVTARCSRQADNYR